MPRFLVLIFILAPAALAFELPGDCSQAVIGMTSSWQSSHVTVSLYEKDREGNWRKAAGPWSGRCAKKGLAWGRGLHPLAPDSPRKTEGDWRSPAGVFRIGGAWGYHKAISKHPELTYRRVTSRDLWVEDPSSSYYNRHLILGHEPSKVWEKRRRCAKMTTLTRSNSTSPIIPTQNPCLERDPQFSSTSGVTREAGPPRDAPPCLKSTFVLSLPS